MGKKKIFTVLMTLLLPIVMWGQSKMSVAHFQMVPTDLTAIQNGTTCLDQNGDKCALIKVKTTQKNFSFDVGSLGVQKVVYHTAEVWVYIPYGSKKITISHPLLGQIDYHFRVPIEKGRTYHMDLTTNTVVTSVFDEKHSGRLILHIQPQRAMVGLDGRVETITNGVIDQKVFFGAHQYRISAERYHDLVDTITVASEAEPVERTVRLKQAWGWVKFDSGIDLSDARLYVDEDSRGLIGSNPIDITSGTHLIRIMKPLYKTYEQKMIIKDSVVTTLSPNLISDFGTVSLNVPDKESTIWVDDQLMGTGSFDGNLGTGNHVVVCKKPYYRQTRKEIYVSNGSSNSYQLDAPSPIYSSIRINTNHVPVNISIDKEDNAKSTGEYSNDQILIGPHNIVVSQKGYKTVQFDADLKEGETFEKNINMEAVVDVDFHSKPHVLDCYIDGVLQGQTPMTIEMNAGRHTISYKKDGYTPDSWTRDFTKDGYVFSKHLNKIYFHKNEFYIEGGGLAGNQLSYYAGGGFDIHNVNFEFIYRGGIDDVDCYKIKQYFGGRLGFTIRLGGRWRLTPQIGGGYTEITDGTEVEEYNSSEGKYEETRKVVADVTTGSGDLKIEVALVRGVSIVIVPEYYWAIKKSKEYEYLEEQYDKMKGWGTGFACSLGLHLYI